MFGLSKKERDEAAREEQEEKNLCDIILNHREGGRSSEEAKKAIAYCQLCMDEYEWWFNWNEKKWLRWQKVTIWGGVIATLAGVVTVPSAWMEWAPSLHSLYWLRSVPAAIATIAAGYLGSFNYREDAVRHEITGNALWNEMARFQSCAAPYNNKTEAEDTNLFTNTICLIVESELRSWGALVRGNRPEEAVPPHQPPPPPGSTGSASAPPPASAAE
jgi:hypothetical protein